MKTLLSITIPTIALFVAGAWTMHQAQKPGAASPTDVLPSAVLNTSSVQKSPQIWASKKLLYKGETLALQFAAPNPNFLGVVDPSGHFFYVVFPLDAAVGKLKPFIDSEQFASVSNLKLNTRTFKADPYQYGVYTNQRVFTKSGTYTFIMGENLHVDDPEFVEKVEIQYVHESRPAIAMK
jgi:hypothetical protein